MYQPDAIAALEYRGGTFLLTANEGDSRPAEETRVADVVLDLTSFPNAAMLKAPGNIGRLRITNLRGDTDQDGDFDALYAFGGRSFSIWSPAGELVFDSGVSFELVTAAAVPSLFNSNGDSAARSTLAATTKALSRRASSSARHWAAATPSSVWSVSAGS